MVPTKKCVVCGNSYSYDKHAGHKAWEGRKFCSSRCNLVQARTHRDSKWVSKGEAHPHAKHLVEKVCAYCGKVIHIQGRRRPSRHFRQTYCSLVCAAQGRKQPRMYKGYWWIAVSPGKRRPVHVLMVEKVIGRRLKKGEIVHHIDTDRGHNENSNFLVCDIGYHRWLHERMAQLYAQEHFGSPSTLLGRAYSG